MIKKILAFFLLLFIIPPPTYAQKASIVIVNQIRGTEDCCQSGSTDLWASVSGSDQFKNLPMGWALRFDAISTKFVQPLPPGGELGLLLEVTPGLAAASSVSYRGSPDGRDWYMAKHSFLVGYTPEERKKLIDTLFLTFKKRFGYFPTFTAGWMVDGWSLSYIQNIYHVVFHELTKEQYETDSYTLYGGLFNFPYYPSKVYPLLPGNQDDKLNIIVARQTASDLLYNYGSSKTIYTSQPNDYLSDAFEKKDISYFKQLINDVVNQKIDLRFGLIGFENSFDFKKYGKEYLRQLEYLLSLQENGIIDVYTPSNFAKQFKTQHVQNPSFYLAKDFEAGKKVGTLWYFGQTYRARLLLEDGRVILDDLRNFMPLPDPYLANPATADYAYWIIPYLIDGSQQYQLSKEQKNFLQRKDLLGNTVSDVYTSPFGILLGENPFELKQLEGRVEIIFSEGEGAVKLLPNEIIFQGLDNLKFTKPIDETFQALFEKGNSGFEFDRHFEFLLQRDNNKLNLGWRRGSSFAHFFTLEKLENGFSLKPNTPEDLSFLTSMFQPDRGDLSIDPTKSIFYWNNRSAIAGRNPLRLFILPLNTIGRPTMVKEVKFDSEKSEELHIVYPQDYSFRVSPWFVDITSDDPIRSALTITVDGTVIAQDIPIEFITDCRSYIKVCIRNPQELLSYLSYLIKEQFVMFTEKSRRSQ